MKFWQRKKLLNDPNVIAVFRIPLTDAAALVQLSEVLPKIYGDDLMFQLVDGYITFRLPEEN